MPTSRTKTKSSSAKIKKEPGAMVRRAAAGPAKRPRERAPRSDESEKSDAQRWWEGLTDPQKWAVLTAGTALIGAVTWWIGVVGAAVVMTTATGTTVRVAFGPAVEVLLKQRPG